MKTYSETRNEPPFDWNKALNEDEINWSDLTDRAGSWVTCACGNQCDVIPRKECGEPVDSKLARLGLRFWARISDENLDAAKSILALIEKRAAELIMENKN